MSSWQWSLYAITVYVQETAFHASFCHILWVCLKFFVSTVEICVRSALFAYGEGYKAFQLGYAPMVVARSLTLPGRHILVRVLLATPYCMGLFHATRKRLLTSWGVLVGVNLLIVGIKYMPYPYRSIVDAGAVVGLVWGTLSIVVIWLRVVFFGAASTADPCLPIPGTPKKLF